MQNVGRAGEYRGIHVVQDAELEKPAAAAEQAGAAGAKHSKYVLDVEHGHVFARPRAWTPATVQILRADDQQKKELAASTDGFSGYLMAAIDANAKYFLPEQPTKSMTKDRVTFAHRANQLLGEATDLAKELYPDRAARDRAYDAVDRALFRLFVAIYGAEDQRGVSVPATQWVRMYDQMKELADGMMSGKSWAELADETRLRLGDGGPHISDLPGWWDRIGMEPLASARPPREKILILDMCHGLDAVRAKED